MSRIDFWDTYAKADMSKYEEAERAKASLYRDLMFLNRKSSEEASKYAYADPYPHEVLDWYQQQEESLSSSFPGLVQVYQEYDMESAPQTGLRNHNNGYTFVIDHDKCRGYSRDYPIAIIDEMLSWGT